MVESGRTIRLLFLDSQERTFPNASLDTSTSGWVHVTRLEVDEGPISGIAEVIAGYRIEALKGWEYVQGTGEDSRP